MLKKLHFSYTMASLREEQIITYEKTHLKSGKHRKVCPRLALSTQGLVFGLADLCGADGVSSVEHAKLGKEHFLMPDGFEKITLVKRTESITEVT